MCVNDVVFTQQVIQIVLLYSHFATVLDVTNESRSCFVCLPLHEGLNFYLLPILHACMLQNYLFIACFDYLAKLSKHSTELFLIPGYTFY